MSTTPTRTRAKAPNSAAMSHPGPQNPTPAVSMPARRASVKGWTGTDAQMSGLLSWLEAFAEWRKSGVWAGVTR